VSYCKTGITANSGENVIVDGVAEQIGVNLYRLPPHDREINLIELVWSGIKRRVTVNNTQFSASFMNSLLGDTFDVTHTAGTGNWHADNRRNDTPFTLQGADYSS
jgi:hypothetical protein